MARREVRPEPAAARVRRWLGGLEPRVGLVLGSGLGRLAAQLELTATLPYAELPGFAPASVAGHRGEFALAALGGQPILIQSGRFHLYEGHDPRVVVAPVRMMAAVGIDSLILTNAAGGITPGLEAGRLMLIADQINLTGRNGLLGPVYPGEGRFPDMSDPFDSGLRALTRQTARALAIDLAEGTYAGVLGPSYETAAEIRMLARLGADAVGMSTVLEVVAARGTGLRCLAFSVITNRAAGLGVEPLSHEDVVRVADLAAGRLGQLLEGVIGRLA